MMLSKQRVIPRLLQDRSGASMVEFSIVVFFFLVLTGGVVEFTHGWFQWNSASKALQAGVRLAAVSDPISSDLSSMTGLEGGAAPEIRCPLSSGHATEPISLAPTAVPTVPRL